MALVDEVSVDVVLVAVVVVWELAFLKTKKKMMTMRQVFGAAVVV